MAQFGSIDLLNIDFNPRPRSSLLFRLLKKHVDLIFARYLRVSLKVEIEFTQIRCYLKSFFLNLFI